MYGDFKPLLSNPKFRYLWASQILSQLTIHVMNFLLLVVLFNETGSAIAVSLLWVAYALPAILVGPIAAASVDMIDRRKMLIVANLAQAVIILGYAYIHSFSVFLLYGVVIAYSFFNQFYIPAEFAALPSLIKKKNYPAANGLFFLTQQGAVVLGFSIAGLLNQNFGFERTLYICSLFLLLAFISVSRLPKMVPKKKIPKRFDDVFFTFFEEIMKGYNFLKSKPGVYIPFLMMLSLQVVSAVVVVSAPIIALDIFAINIDMAGLFIAVPAGIGAIIASLTIPKLLNRRWRKITSVKFAMILLACSMFYLSIITPRLEIMLRLSTSMLALMTAGAAFIAFFIPLQTHLQEITPGGLRGRVFGNYWFLVTIATIFPVILSGTISELLGIRVLLFTIGAISAGGVYMITRYGCQFVGSNKFND